MSDKRHSFNPSVGMAGVQAIAGRAPPRLDDLVSIPQSGWRGFKLERHYPGRVLRAVSIPQSGWRGFKRFTIRGLSGAGGEFQSLSRDGGGSSSSSPMRWVRSARGFNPSVGMAGVQALTPLAPWKDVGKFQSLSRDGGGSSACKLSELWKFCEFQSLSRDGGGSSDACGRVDHSQV